MAVNPKKLRPYDEPPKVSRPLIPSAPDSAATAFLVLSLLWLVVATGIGTLWAGTVLFPDLLNLSLEFDLPLIGVLGVEISRTTVEAGFAGALVFGWLSNAAFAAILFITPRITGARLADDMMGFGAAGMWNVAVAAGVAAVYLPALAGKGLLTAFPLPVEGLMLLGLLTVTGVMFRTLMAAGRELPYVSLLFFGVALLATMGAIALAAGASLLDLDETATALVDAFVARAIATYWVLGVALGTLFYVVPRATGNPLASGGMALLSWLLWAAFAGLSAIGALVDPSVPYVVTTIGNVGTMLLVAPVFLAVTALALTIHGRWTLMLDTGTLAFAGMAMTFLLATSLLEAIGALRSVQGLVSATEWPMGVWLFATLGSATFAFFALADHAAPRLLRRDWGGSPATDAQLWATFTGVVVAGLALMAGGIAHGSLLAQGAAADEIRSTLTWFWLAAGAGLGLTALGGVAAMATLFMMYTTARRAEYAVATDGPAGGSAPASAGAAH
ncbi:MAG TPA: cbb3-type cytochrome c oxidase subunit I [Candidatus Limnocylindrales bacterium]|nr:cbb3-type cytochrome c oxidase subunit I [Candidatus Limnocylindrales bacterium]